MVLRRFSALRRVVALAPLLLLAVYVPGQMMLRCRMDGVIRATCCCPAGDAGAGGTAQRSVAAVKAQDCCEHQALASARQPVEPPSTAPTSIAAPALSGLLAFTASTLSSPGDPARAHRARQANGPPGDGGPTLVLLKHAFLI